MRARVRRLGHPVAAGPALTAVAGRVTGLAVAAVVLAVVVQHVRLPPLCLLRAATDVPCPFCGGTTAAAALGAGRPVDALAASPLAVLGGVTWAAWPVLGRSVPVRRVTGSLTFLVAVLGASEAWQVVRALG